LRRGDARLGVERVVARPGRYHQRGGESGGRGSKCSPSCLTWWDDVKHLRWTHDSLRQSRSPRRSYQEEYARFAQNLCTRPSRVCLGRGDGSLRPDTMGSRFSRGCSILSAPRGRRYRDPFCRRSSRKEGSMTSASTLVYCQRQTSGVVPAGTTRAAEHALQIRSQLWRGRVKRRRWLETGAGSQSRGSPRVTVYCAAGGAGGNGPGREAAL